MFTLGRYTCINILTNIPMRFNFLYLVDILSLKHKGQQMKYYIPKYIQRLKQNLYVRRNSTACFCFKAKRSNRFLFPNTNS